MLKGKAFKFEDDISTDHIIPANYIQILAGNIPELAKHAMEDADPTFVDRVKPGDFIVGREGFGIGSSREQAPLVIKEAGVSAVLAKSVGRIFYRNAVNVGLPILICDTEQIADGDELEVDLATGLVKDATNGAEVSSAGLPKLMLGILNEGGLIPYVKKYGRFTL
ncbi:3-isopropylmalate dehydratase small subunit [Chloroflexota bacterium]